MDVPFGLWISVLAGVVAIAAAVAAGLPRPLAIWVLAGWLAVDVALGAAGVFAADANRHVPGVVFGIALPIVAGLWLLRRTTVAAGLSPAWLIGVQVYRVVGAVFVAGWALGYLPAAFALPAGLGDVAVGLAAPVVARRLGRSPEGARRLAIAWNVAGLADLVVAVTLGFLTSPSPFQQLAHGDPNVLVTRMPFVLIPTFAVPLSVLLHVAALGRLRAGAAHDAGAASPGTARARARAA